MIILLPTVERAILPLPLAPLTVRGAIEGSLASEDAAMVSLFSLVASGQIKLRMIDGRRKIGDVFSQHTVVAA